MAKSTRTSSRSKKSSQSNTCALRCKPGDLAYITKTQPVSEIGRIVEVIGPSRKNGNPERDVCDWFVRVVGVPVTCFDLATGERSLESKFIIEDKFLRPISGVPVDDEETTDTPFEKNIRDAGVRRA